MPEPKVASASPPHSSVPSTGRLVTFLVGFVMLGVPTVGFLWDTLTDLLSGTLQLQRALLAIPAAGLLAVLWIGLARTIQRLDRTLDSPIPPRSL